MGVLTTAYSISPSQMRKLRADENNFKLLLPLDLEAPPKWNVERYEFGKHFEETIGILRVCGYRKTFCLLNFENYYNPDYKNFWNVEGYNLWSVTPAELRIICNELADATFEKLKTVGLAAKATDYFGEVIPEEMYEYYVGKIEEIKDFFKGIAEQGNFLLFAAD